MNPRSDSCTSLCRPLLKWGYFIEVLAAAPALIKGNENPIEWKTEDEQVHNREN